jgi:hypothetical protein
MAIEIKELIVRAFLGRDPDEGKEKTEADLKNQKLSAQADAGQDTMASVIDMLNKQKER